MSTPPPQNYSAIDIACAVEGLLMGSPSWHVTTLCLDHRKVQPHSLFLALKGARHDSHEYVTAALENGAAGAIVERIPEGILDASRLIQVSDTTMALLKLARFYRKNLKNPFILSITGSVGKTSTKEMLRKAFEGVSDSVYANARSLNSKFGLPIALSHCPAEIKYGIFELGMSRPGEMRELSKAVKPHLAIITSIVNAHYEFFKSTESIAKAKAEIFEGLSSPSIGIFPDDIAQSQILKEAAGKTCEKIYTFGSQKSDAFILEHKQTKNGQEARLSIRGEGVTISLPLKGDHWVRNALPTLLSISIVGEDLKKAAKNLSSFTPPLGRGNIIDLGEGTLIFDETYNANPTSMKAALGAFVSYPTKNKRVAILGDMSELGTLSKEAHEGLKEDLYKAEIDILLAYGNEMRNLVDILATEKQLEAYHFTQRDELKKSAVKILRMGDHVIIKGSRSQRLEEVLEFIKDNFEKGPY